MNQPPPPQPPPPEQVPPPESDGGSIVPVLLSILAAYAAYRTTKGAVTGTWRAAAQTLGLADMAGNALDNVARRGLARQRKAAGRPGDELWEHNEEAVKAGVEAGVRTLVDILKARPEPESAPADGKPTNVQPDIPNPAEVAEMAQGIAASVAGAAQNDAASRAGWDKIWQSQHDLRVRYSHAFLDRNRVAAAEPFVTPDGVRIRFPHDPSAPLEEVINCRCICKYVRASTRRH